MAKFKPGQSGNLKGRPKGVKDKRIEYREIFQSRAPELIEKVIALALEGDTASMRLCIERIAPALKAQDCPVNISNLDKAESLTAKGNVILKTLGSGEVTPNQASLILSALASQAKLTEIDDLTTRVEVLEKSNA